MAIWLSPTALKNYKTCPYKYYGVNILKIYEPASPETEFGIFVHQVMEAVGKRIMTTNAASYSVMKSFVVPDHFTAEQKLIYEKIVRNVDINYTSVFSQDVVGVEKFIEKAEIRPGVFLTAKIDREDFSLGNIDTDDNVTRARCLDYKTGKVDDNKFLEYDFQFILYSDYLLRKYPKADERIVTWVSFKDGEVNVINKHASIANMHIVEQLADKIIADKTYNPCQGKLCDWCSLKKMNKCPLYGGQDIRPFVTSQPVKPVVVEPVVEEQKIESKELSEMYELELYPGLTIRCGVKVTGNENITQPYFLYFKEFIKNRIEEYKGE